jgi:peptide/nickel transport system permease protein
MAIPGVGGALVQAVAEREYEVILSLVFVISMFYVVANFLVDLLYSFLDPRIRRGTSR